MADVRFWRELRRRHVFRVAAGHAVVGWLLIQVATQVFAFFDLPNWSVRPALRSAVYRTTLCCADETSGVRSAIHVN